jgi:gliding motility-associated-like protein/uncharacterized repeat protein (TIGR01451 family)
MGSEEGTLLPGEKATYYADYVIEQADIDAGKISNQAEVTAHAGETEVKDLSCLMFDYDHPTVVKLCQKPNLGIVKTAREFQQLIGSDVVFDITVENTGNVTLYDVFVEDVQTGDHWIVEQLAPGAKDTKQVNVEISQALIDGRCYANTAIAEIREYNEDEQQPGGGQQISDDYEVVMRKEASVKVCFIQTPSLSLAKSVDVSTVSREGVVLNYTLVVKNTGNVTLSSGTLTDPKTGLTVPGITLAPGEEKAYSKAYTVTLADILSGAPIVNVAEVTLVDGGGTPYRAQSQAVVNIGLSPSIGLEKTADVSEVDRAGDVIRYTLTVTNTGDAPLINVVVSDPLTGFEEQIGLLLPGQAKAFVTSYSVTEADFENLEEVLNTATAKGTAPGSVGVEDTATAGVQLNLLPPPPAPLELHANDDDFGTHPVSFGGVIGNILDNDRLDGARPDPADVDFEFTGLDGIIGLLIGENGELGLIPGVNEARDYTLKYILRETAFPDNDDEALVSFRILNDEADLSLTKEALQDEVFEGDLFDYELVVSNVGETDATQVTLTDNIPAGVTYQSFTVTENTGGAVVTPTISGNSVTFSIPVLGAGESVTLRIRVKAGAKGTVVNTAVVGSNEDDLNGTDNTDSDETEIQPFRIPNALTPNNDGKNDVFEIPGLGKYASNKITILNRYGDQVLERENYGNDWNAAGLTAGTYFYLLRVTDAQGNATEFKGWIQLIKE